MFYERPDKELINFGLEDIDELMRLAGIRYLHEDVRMQRLGIEKNLTDNFKKQSFWGKWGATIMNALYILLVTISLVVLFAKLIDVSGAIGDMATSVKEMSDTIKGVAPSTRPDETTTGTSGLVPAFIFILFRRKQWDLKKLL